MAYPNQDRCPRCSMPIPAMPEDATPEDATPEERLCNSCYDTARSISDDDVCSTCTKCDYRPGDLSWCDDEHDGTWPATFDQDGYAISCDVILLRKITKGDL